MYDPATGCGDCVRVDDAICTDDHCVTLTPTPTATDTHTPTHTASCCDCGDAPCRNPANGCGSCTPVFDAVCMQAHCATLTPTPTPTLTHTPTHTASCCECGDGPCRNPTNGCGSCTPVFDAICMQDHCATLTPTPTPTLTHTPTHTASCCDCGDAPCRNPASGCGSCTPVFDAVCLQDHCATLTPTPTDTNTPTPTSTPTAPCCQCPEPACHANVNGCGECVPVYDAVCIANQCATVAAPHTRTCTPTPTRRARMELISVNTRGVAGNNASGGVAVNRDGAFVTFFSDATDLVSGDANGDRDVFLRDVIAEKTELISVGLAGAAANAPSHANGGSPAVSADGNVVAFYSDASNLAAIDANGLTDVFVRVLAIPTVTPSCAPAASATPTPTVNIGIFLVSVSSTGVQGNGPSAFPSLSGDGSIVAFQSVATNLVPNDTNGASDVFVHDRCTGATERACGVQGNAFSISPVVSANGRYVAFVSAATNLVANDTNGRLDIFVCDRHTNILERVSGSNTGRQGDGDSILPAISGDGLVVAFKSTSENLISGDNNSAIDLFARDTCAQTTERINVNREGGDADAEPFPPSVSQDGHFVAFGSAATNLTFNDANAVPSVFMRDRIHPSTKLVDVVSGQQANASTPDAPVSISADGSYVGFVSLASNLVPNDRNETLDVYLALSPFDEDTCAAAPARCPGRLDRSGALAEGR